MAGLDRESIMAAVATRLAAIPGLVTFSRRFRDLDKVSVNEQPAIFLVAYRETPQHQKAMPTKWTLNLGIFIYANTSDPAVDPATVLAPLVRAVEAALQWAGGDVGPFAPNTPGSLGGSMSSGVASARCSTARAPRPGRASCSFPSKSSPWSRAHERYRVEDARRRCRARPAPSATDELVEAWYRERLCNRALPTDLQNSIRDDVDALKARLRAVEP
jgi:hypothetical protein